MSQPLFDEIREVENRIKQASHVLLCVAYDGTLAQFAATPLDAHLSPQMERVLQSVSEHEHSSVAVISGRERADLQSRLGIPGLIYAGNHGLEISGPGYLFVEPTAAANVGALQEMADQLTQKLQGIEGAVVEFKGLTISVHHRQAQVETWEEVRRLVHAALAGSTYPFVLTTGEKVFEIRPRVYWHKGSAVCWMVEKLAKPGLLTIYLGDDITDEDAFVSLAEGVTVRVGESPESAARYALDGPVEVRRFLELVDELLRQKDFQTEDAGQELDREVLQR